MGAGVPSGLQNQFEGLGASWVGSIPTYSRHPYPWQGGIHMDKKQELLKQLPKVDEVLKDQRLSLFFENTPRDLVVESVREELDKRRQRILSWDNEAGQPIPEDLFAQDHDIILEKIIRRIKQKRQKSLRKVINATGTIVHTNLGRSRLSVEAIEQVREVAAHASTLEYDLSSGSRGSRHDHLAHLLCRITGAEAAIAVNNNAAAVLLCLSALAKDKDVIVSRGELVEIGGSFRIPDIMALGGARLVEVGTTNKTRITDYRNAIRSDETGLLLKVHTSNFKIMGFTAEATLEELVNLGRETGIPVIHDLGSGLLVDLKPYGIVEPTVLESLKAGVDLVLFSGDKLLGGPQAGILVGKKEWINRMKQHPLARALRLDKMTLAALEATFQAYLDPEQAKVTIPTLSMIARTPEELERRAYNLIHIVQEKTKVFDLQVIATEGQVGGGSTPNQFLHGYAVAVTADDMTPDHLERRLRGFETPIIGRISKDQLLLDLRTLDDEDLPLVARALAAIGETHA